MSTSKSDGPQNFIRDIIDADLASGKHSSVVTRFPPEPNGYLHIGHAKSICLNFGLARAYDGNCHLRFDDTNPTTEDEEFVESIQHDVRWLGFDWRDKLLFASDYFEQLYAHAVHLIKTGKAYVCSLSEEQVRTYRGTITEPGKPSPHRGRSIEDSLDLLARMRAGEFAESEHVLRAKIDMASPNMKMRDPLLYRIKHAEHYRTGKDWCIYPLYDFTHCLSDAIEGITHSICTLEFENNRELYDWVIAHSELNSQPQQYEFARLHLSYTVMSKRKLALLVADGHVEGWDDPRMPSIAGMRRRGYTPAAIRAFCDMIGVAKNNSVVDVGKLEYCIRDDLNRNAPRLMCVLRPLKVVLSNYPEGRVEQLEAPSYPADIGKSGSRQVPLSRVIYIERDDFRLDPPKKYFRLAPGREVRLRYAYVIRCDEVIKDEAGEVVELRCSYDADTLSSPPAGRKVKGTLHWVSAEHALDCSLRLYDRLFCAERPEGAEHLNPSSLEQLEGCKIEPSVATAEPGARYQFERQGYYCVDLDSQPAALVFNRTVTLRDGWAKIVASRNDTREPAADKAAAAAAKTSRATPGPAAKPVALEGASLALAQRYTAELGVPAASARVLAQQAQLATIFDEAVAWRSDPANGPATDPATIAKWVVNELQGELKSLQGGALPLSGAQLAELLAMVEMGDIPSTAAKRVLAEMVQSGADPAAVVEQLGIKALDDDHQLRELIAKVLSEHPEEAQRYREGKTSLLGFFLGQVMRASRGAADPNLTRELLSKALSA